MAAENSRTISLAQRFRILVRDNHTCRYCGRRAAPDVQLEIDHIYPFARGGPTTDENLAAACWECNAGKRDTILPGTEPPRLVEKPVASETDVLRAIAKVLDYALPEEDPWEGSDTEIVNALAILCDRDKSIAEFKRDVDHLLVGLALAAKRGMSLCDLEEETDEMYGNG